MSSVSQYQLNLSGLAYQKYKLKSSALSLRSLRSSKSIKSLNSQKNNVYWWNRRPILLDAFYTSLQKASYHAAIFIIVECIIQIFISIFNVYCLLCATPGSKHFRQLGISFIFVYTGNQTVRWLLIISSSLLLICAIILIPTTIILLKALKKENELRFIYFLKALAIFILIRFSTLIFEFIVNDLYYFYHQFNLVFWIFSSFLNIFSFLIVLSNYQELKDLTKLEDFAKEKIASMNISKSFSLNNSNIYGLGSTSNKLFTLNDILRNQSIQSTPTICRSNISDYEKNFKEQQKQLFLQQQQLKQLKMNKAYKQLKNTNFPLQPPSTPLL